MKVKVEAENVGCSTEQILLRKNTSGARARSNRSCVWAPWLFEIFAPMDFCSFGSDSMAIVGAVSKAIAIVCLDVVVVVVVRNWLKNEKNTHEKKYSPQWMHLIKSAAYINSYKMLLNGQETPNLLNDIVLFGCFVAGVKSMVLIQLFVYKISNKRLLICVMSLWF